MPEEKYSQCKNLGERSCEKKSDPAMFPVQNDDFLFTDKLDLTIDFVAIEAVCQKCKDGFTQK